MCVLPFFEQLKKLLTSTLVLTPFLKTSILVFKTSNSLMKTKHFWQLREKKDCIFSPYLGMKHFAEKYFLATRINFIPGRKKFVSVEIKSISLEFKKKFFNMFSFPVRSGHREPSPSRGRRYYWYQHNIVNNQLKYLKYI